MNRPKKEFIPTSLSDLNIDSISLGSNGDRHNNNSNGARCLNNLDRSTSKSSYNLASYQKSLNTNTNSNFSHSSKIFGSQSNINSRQNVNNFNINSPSSDRWEQAWEDNNNIYRPPSYQTQQREHSFEKTNKHSFSMTSNRSTMNHYVDDPFDDPWSGILAALLLITIALCTKYLIHTW